MMWPGLMVKGFFVLSGRRGDVNPYTNKKVKNDHYILITLKEAYPSFKITRRQDTISDWSQIKALYDNRCATCGAKEGEPHYLHKASLVSLEKGHCNPNKELSSDNVIPQCQECNKSYQDKFIFSKDGKVSKINIKSKQILSVLEKEDIPELIAILMNEQKG